MDIMEVEPPGVSEALTRAAVVSPTGDCRPIEDEVTFLPTIPQQLPLLVYVTGSNLCTF